jgi:L-amino acid N-acyltransferase YncA/N-acetylglutamate synthase-like GNAT family acetyltransferase
MNEPVSIEDATVVDAEAILALQRAAYQQEAVLYDAFDIPPLTQTLPEIRDTFASHLFLKAVSGDAIVGSVRARLDGGTCHVGRLIVHPDYQGRGTGSRLLSEIEARFPGAERFELFTGHKSRDNLQFYARRGYAEFDRRAVSDRLTLVYMHKGGRGAEDMELSIRRVREEDATSIVALLNPIIRAGTHTIMDREVSVDEQRAFIRGFPERGVFQVAVSNRGQRVLGLQDVVPLAPGSSALRHVGEISTFVALASQRLGIGRSLCQATFTAARAQGFLKLWATIRADNPQAVTFYQSQGFRVVGTAEKHAFVRGQYIDEILAEKLLY